MMITAKIKSFQPNGYQDTIKKGLSAIHNFNSGMSLGKDDDTEQLDRLKEEGSYAERNKKLCNRHLFVSRIAD